MCFLWWCDCLPASYPDVVSLESANRWSNRCTVPVKLSMGQGGILEASWDCSNSNCVKEIHICVHALQWQNWVTFDIWMKGWSIHLCSVVAHVSIYGYKWSHFALCTVFTLLTVRVAVFDPSVAEQNWQPGFWQCRGGIRGPRRKSFIHRPGSSDNHKFVRIFT